MEGREGSSTVSGTVCYVAAAAAFLVAAIECSPRLLPDGLYSVVPYLVRATIQGVAILGALIVLRKCIADTASSYGVRRALLWLCMVQVVALILLYAGYLTSGGGMRIIYNMINYGSSIVNLFSLALFVFLAYRMWWARAQGLGFLALFAGLAAVGELRYAASLPSSAMFGMIAITLAYGALGVYLLRNPHPLYLAERPTQPEESAPLPGHVIFARIIIALSAVSTAVVWLAEAAHGGGGGPLVLVSVLLLAPQWALLDYMGLGDYLFLLFPLALATLPILLLPVGLRLTASRVMPLWVAVVLQCVFLLVYAVIGVFSAISGIQG